MVHSKSRAIYCNITAYIPFHLQTVEGNASPFRCVAVGADVDDAVSWQNLPHSLLRQPPLLLPCLLQLLHLLNQLLSLLKQPKVRDVVWDTVKEPVVGPVEAPVEAPVEQLIAVGVAGHGEVAGNGLGTEAILHNQRSTLNLSHWIFQYYPAVLYISPMHQCVVNRNVLRHCVAHHSICIFQYPLQLYCITFECVVATCNHCDHNVILRSSLLIDHYWKWF